MKLSKENAKTESRYDFNEFLKQLNHIINNVFVKINEGNFSKNGVNRHTWKIIELLFGESERIKFEDLAQPLLPTNQHLSHVNSLFVLCAGVCAKQLLKADDNERKGFLESIPYLEIQRELMLQMTFFAIPNNTTSDLAIVFLQQRNYLQAFQCILHKTSPNFTFTSLKLAYMLGMHFLAHKRDQEGLPYVETLLNVFVSREKYYMSRRVKGQLPDIIQCSYIV